MFLSFKSLVSPPGVRETLPDTQLMTTIILTLPQLEWPSVQRGSSDRQQSFQNRSNQAVILKLSIFGAYSAKQYKASNILHL